MYLDPLPGFELELGQQPFVTSSLQVTRTHRQVYWRGQAVCPSAITEAAAMPFVLLPSQKGLP